ncbi:hypothetical protein ACKS0A_06188 [Histoplasma ohiense]
MKALTTSTRSGSGDATTADSTTAGCFLRTDSTSNGPERKSISPLLFPTNLAAGTRDSPILYPDEFITSSDRPTNQRVCRGCNGNFTLLERWGFIAFLVHNSQGHTRDREAH